ncbi:hypothetical protein AAH978_03935 [Streptomyces sp. ZYX-F-203]
MDIQQVAGEPVNVETILGVVTATVVCPVGTVLLSGGYLADAEPQGLIQIIESKRDDINPNQWNVSGLGLTGLVSGLLQAYAVCTV